MTSAVDAIIVRRDSHLRNAISTTPLLQPKWEWQKRKRKGLRICDQENGWEIRESGGEKENEAGMRKWEEREKSVRGRERERQQRENERLTKRMKSGNEKGWKWKKGRSVRREKDEGKKRGEKRKEGKKMTEGKSRARE